MAACSAKPVASSLGVTMFAAAICAAFVVGVGVMATTRLSNKQAAAIEAEADEVARPALRRNRQSPNYRIPVGTDESGTTTVAA